MAATQELEQVPGIATSIFAPRASNGTLSLVCCGEPLLDALAQEAYGHLDQAAERIILENIRHTAVRNPALISQYLNIYGDPRSGSAAATSLRNLAPSVPWARHFPFASHIDFSERAVEGLLYDGDDAWSEE